MINDKPFYIGLGIHKSATTWMYACLYEHPDICIPNKDIHFFYHDDLFQKGYEWYENNITLHYKNQSVIADFSVVTLVGNNCPSRIHDQYPDAKLFLCLRDPVDRAWSHYVQDLKKGHIPLETNFEDALEKDTRYIQFGQYKKHLLKFQAIFPKEQIKVFLYDDVQADPRQFIKELYTYFGVDDNFVPSYLDQKPNSAKLSRYAWITRMNTRLSESLKSNKYGQPLWWKIKSSGLPTLLRRYNSVPLDRITKPNQTFMSDLRAGFKEDITFIKDYLDRQDLSW